MPKAHSLRKILVLIGKALRGIYISHSVRAVLVVVFTVIAVLQIAQSSLDILDGVRVYRSTALMTVINKAFDNVFEAARNLTFERARTTSALNGPDPISNMDLSILQEYRNRSEYLLKSTLRGTQAVSPEQVTFFEQDLESLKELRNRLDLELSKNSQ